MNSDVNQIKCNKTARQGKSESSKEEKACSGKQLAAICQAFNSIRNHVPEAYVGIYL